MATERAPIGSPEDLHYHRRRGGFSRNARFNHVVEGKQVSTRQIADRLGVSMTTALDRALRGPFPLTWAGLSIRGKRKKAA